MSELVDESIALLSRLGVSFDEGMSEGELESTEQRFEIRFNPDHREFLSKVTPVGDSWIRWRDDSEERLQSKLNWPIEGALFDVENNAFWPRSWGTRPRRHRRSARSRGAGDSKMANTHPALGTSLHGGSASTARCSRFLGLADRCHLLRENAPRLLQP
ncbi:MAG: hypothetical protein JWQ64_2182 [Subtercola sp.]|nr:hypothetical protein [Subtercola sp.]